MSLSETDRQLLDRCLEGTPRAWDDFVDRFLGLILHVIDHTAKARGIQLAVADREDLSAEFMLELIRNDLAVLRRFRRTSSLATYLTVIVRRLVVRRILAESRFRTATPAAQRAVVDTAASEQPMIHRDEVEHLIHRLDSAEANVIRMYHLEGKSYDEISQATGMPSNSIGPLLSRARSKMRNGST